VKAYIWPTILVETVSAAVFLLAAALLVVGAIWRKRPLMLPYMILQVTDVFLSP
jgi:hypothetical protein